MRRYFGSRRERKLTSDNNGFVGFDTTFDNSEVALLALSLFLSSMTLSGGRATVLQGAVHLVVFIVFLFLAMVP